MNKDGLEFAATVDQEFLQQNGHRSHFGRNVPAGLVDGMDSFLEEKRRTPGFRSMGPVALGAFLWLDDPELAACLARFAHTCVVVSKQGAANATWTSWASSSHLPTATTGCWPVRSPS
ncbi:hypothetical protein ACFYO6_39090 [Streptomyces anthocyanicus]|uniref:hypothetical protein n=1 Tax=Streptomyces anthocyanicus TaxID=68174 RepID=UPI003631864F